MLQRDRWLLGACRSAFTKNFNVMMLSDGNAGKEQSLHEASLRAFETSFGKVLTCEEAKELFRQHKQN